MTSNKTKRQPRINVCSLEPPKIRVGLIVFDILFHAWEPSAYDLLEVFQILEAHVLEVVALNAGINRLLFIRPQFVNPGIHAPHI